MLPHGYRLFFLVVLLAAQALVPPLEMRSAHLNVAIVTLDMGIAEVIVNVPALASRAKTHPEVGMPAGSIAAVQDECLPVAVLLDLILPQVSVAVVMRTEDSSSPLRPSSSTLTWMCLSKQWLQKLTGWSQRTANRIGVWNLFFQVLTGTPAQVSTYLSHTG